MTPRIVKDGNVSKVMWEGEFTYNEHPIFRKVVEDILGDGTKEITLDLSHVAYIDSAGLGMFLVAQEQSEKEGWRFSIVNPQDRVAKMFQLAKLNKIIDIS